MARGMDAIDSTPGNERLMVLLLPYMILAIFYVGRATVKLIIGLAVLIALILANTIKAINWVSSTANKR